MNLYCTCSLVTLTLVDDLFGVGGYWVINKDVNMVFCRLKCTNITLQHKVWTIAALNSFFYIRLSFMD